MTSLKCQTSQLISTRILCILYTWISSIYFLIGTHIYVLQTKDSCWKISVHKRFSCFLFFLNFVLYFSMLKRKKVFRLLFPLQCMCVCIAGKDNYRSSGREENVRLLVPWKIWGMRHGSRSACFQFNWIVRWLVHYRLSTLRFGLQYPFLDGCVTPLLTFR
jgi:hypothetical protein